MSLNRRIDDDRDEASLAQLIAIGEAFNAHDVDAIMSHFAEDGVFDNARGPDIHGKRYVGKKVLDGFFRALMAAHPDIQWLTIDNRVSGDKGYAEWRRQCTLPSGEKQDWLGLDIFTFRAGKVVKKDTYFKIVE